MRGGRLIIDLKNINHTEGVAVKHPGIYNLIKSTRKPVRLCNFVINNTEYQDVDLIGLTASGNSYSSLILFTTGNYKIIITDTDDVTIILGE